MPKEAIDLVSSISDDQREERNGKTRLNKLTEYAGSCAKAIRKADAKQKNGRSIPPHFSSTCRIQLVAKFRKETVTTVLRAQMEKAIREHCRTCRHCLEAMKSVPLAG